jgi:hypothetical protein
MNGYRRARSWRSSVVAAVVGVTAVLGSILLPAQSAEAAVQHIRVDGKPVTVTSVGSNNWGSLAPNNIDTVVLKDGSRGSYWSFDVRPGQCVRMTMRSEDFNPYLSLRTGGPDGNNLANQDGANGRAQITLMNANGGTYYLLASSSGRGDKRGEYTLDVNRC